MQIQELVGSEVYVKQRFAGEHQGRILSVPMAVELSDVSPLIPGHVFVQGKNIASRARHIVPQMGRLPSWQHNRPYHGPAKEGR
jgi:hypothetical protein